MARFIARRILYAIALLFFTSLILFMARPLLEYLSFIRDLLAGNLGASASTGQPVLKTVAVGAPYTIALAFVAATLTFGTAIPLGLLSASRHRTAWDWGASSLAVAGMAIPNFVLALVLIDLFAVRLRWLPVAGADTPASIVLPAVVLAFESIAINLRLVRAAVLEELGREYVRTLSAAGLGASRILWVHALRNALPTLLPMAAIVARNVLGYTLIVEVIFRWPGLGHELVESVLRGDYQEARVLALLFVLSVIAINVVADIGHQFADPKVRARLQAA